MSRVEAGTLPEGALLRRYVDQGAFTDCYFVDFATPITFAAYVTAFYTSPVFKLERWLIGRLMGRRADDDDARALAEGSAARFSAWTVEARATDQLLVAAGRTRSWFMAVPLAAGTRLYFGSAVVPRSNGRLGGGFHALLGFHKLYSRLLLAAAASRLAP